MNYNLPSGVYEILSKVDGKRYIGSSANLRKRWLIHRKKLRIGKHPNEYLQETWNVHGARNLVFKVLEKCPESQLIEREQAWIDHYVSHDRTRGFNKSPTAGSPEGTKHNDQTRQKCRERATRVWGAVKKLDALSQALGYSSYDEYLLGEHWKSFTNRVKEKQCWLCGKTRLLQVHHKTYERLGCEQDDDVVTVCNNCHKAIHRLTQQGTPLLTAHEVLKKRRAGKNKRRKERVWVVWQGLRYTSLRKNAWDAVHALRENGCMEEGSFQPTRRGLTRGLAKKMKKRGISRVLWNRELVGKLL